MSGKVIYVNFSKKSNNFKKKSKLFSFFTSVLNKIKSIFIPSKKNIKSLGYVNKRRHSM